MAQFDVKRYMIIQANKRKKFREESNADVEIEKIDPQRYQEDRTYRRDSDVLINRFADEHNEKNNWHEYKSPLGREKDKRNKRLEEQRKLRR